MPTIAHSHFPPPKSWDEFEDIVCSAAKSRWRNPDFIRHGRQGQKQNGVDVYGNNLQGQLVGLQCKNTLNEITEKIIIDEVEKAESFVPNLASLYIATTGSSDRSIQEFVRTFSKKRLENKSFEVNILFWNDIFHDLSLDEQRLYQHYPQFKPVPLVESHGPSHDQRLFEEFQSIFPYNPAVQLLKYHDFGGPFYRKFIQPLYDFVETWDQPEKEYLDEELQLALIKLYQAAHSMAMHLVEKTVPIGKGEYASVLSDSLREAGPRPNWIIEETRILNEQARLFVPIYEDFLRLCRKKLTR